MTSHFSGLNAISHSLSQDSRGVRSDCRAWQSKWFVMVRYMMVSSANSLMLLLIESGMSFMYIRKGQGPSTDPWGTPDSTGQAPDCSPSRTTFCDLPDKKDLIHAFKAVFMPSRCSFSRSLWWSTLSNALLKSMTMTSVCPPWFKVSYRSWVNWISWVSQLTLLLNPCWLWNRRLFWPRYDKVFEVIICSKTLQQIQVSEIER